MAYRDYGNKPTLDAGAKETNPDTTDVMADSGALSAGIYDVRVIIGASAAAIFQVERRNADNDASVGDVVILYCAAGQSAQFALPYVLEEGERVRVMMNANLTGTAAAAINVERLS